MNTSVSVRLQHWLERMNAGDPQGRDELIRHACDRLRGLARHMLRRQFARVGAFQETDDVLQNAVLRLCRALQDPSVHIATVADFLRLATVQIRRELIDLSRHHFRAGKPRLVSAEPVDPGDSTPIAGDPADSTYAPDRLQDWGEFHSQVAALAEEERAVFELLWYQELSQAEAAELLQVSVPTVKRRWLAARLALQNALKDHGFFA